LLAALAMTTIGTTFVIPAQAGIQNL